MQAGALHEPPEHALSPGTQAIPQPPQFASSVSGSTQAPPQTKAQAATQMPPEHTAPSVHTAFAPEQPPQWFGSSCVFTHTSLHAVWPMGQQMSSESVSPLGHLQVPL